MDNPEEVMQILERFSKSKQKEIPEELDNYLKFVATSGDVVYSWNLIKALFHEKLLNVITDFYNDTPNIKDLPNYPNVDKFCFETMKKVLLEKLDSFHAAPFTIQRICELLADPRKQYSRIDKFMRAIEKNILVVSTQEPGRTRTDSENGDSLNGDLSVDIEMGDNNYPADPLALPTKKPAPETKDDTEEPKTSSSPEVAKNTTKLEKNEEEELKFDEDEKKSDAIDSPVPTVSDSPIIEALIEDTEVKKTPELPEEKQEELEATKAKPIEKLLEDEDNVDLKLPPIETISPLLSIAAILAPTVNSLVDTSTSEDSTDCIVPEVLGVEALKSEVIIPELVSEPKVPENTEWLLEWGDSPPENADGSEPSPAKKLKIDNMDTKEELLSPVENVAVQEVKPPVVDTEIAEKIESTVIPESLKVEEAVEASETIPIETPVVEVSVGAQPVEELEVLLAEVAEVLPIATTEAELLAQNALEDKLLEEPEVEPPTVPELSEIASAPEILETPEIVAALVIAEIPIIPEIMVEVLPAIVTVEMEIATPAPAIDNKMSLDDDTVAATSLVSSIADEADLLMSPVISKMDTDGAEINEMDVDESSGEPMDQ